MRRQERRRATLRGAARATIAAVALPALALLATAAAPPSATAATVSGTVKDGKGLQVLLVRANGTVKKKAITQTNGAFSISGVALGKASLHLVQADGTYYGPIVLKRTSTKAFTFIRGTQNLRLGTVTLRGGYALPLASRTGRYQTLTAYTATAVSGRPIGARRLGLVKTTTPLGLNGAGGDLDRDGVVNAFDIDDNGNRIIDNVDRTSRGAGRPRAGVSGAAPSAGFSAGTQLAYEPAEASTEFRMFSNFKLRSGSSINADIPGIDDIDGLIADNLPPTVTLATQVIGGERASLDGLGNSYLLQHTVGTTTYPLMNWVPATYTNGALDLIAEGVDAQIMPGALPSEIGSGDCFVETAQDGTKYPGTLNFVFNTAPAIKSYQFDTQATATAVAYNRDGSLVGGETLTAPLGASSLTLTLWRPQRTATAAEAAAGSTWIDMGGLMYLIQMTGGPQTPNAPSPGQNAPRTAYSDAGANGVPITLSAENEGVLDSAAVAPANADSTITFTIDLAACYPDWSTFTSGTEFDVDLMAQSAYGDNAARGLFFKLQ